LKSGMVDMESNTTLVQNYPAHEAVPQGEGPFPAAVVVHDEFGLNIFVRGVANRLAQAGFYTLTPALYAFPSSFVELAPALMRSPAPIEFGYDDAFDANARATALTDERGLDLIGKAIRYAQTRSATRSGPVGLLGFSMGARLAFRAACENPGDVAGCVCFYPAGLFSDRLGKGHELAMAGAINLQAPLRFFYGALDQDVSASERSGLKKVLAALGKDVALEEYGGAGHDFFCSDRNTFHVGASKKAWDESLAFFRSRLG
jgi:carboxymethylenebutenolidase